MEKETFSNRLTKNSILRLEVDEEQVEVNNADKYSGITVEEDGAVFEVKVERKKNE